VREELIAMQNSLVDQRLLSIKVEADSPDLGKVSGNSLSDERDSTVETYSLAPNDDAGF
jgi:hypothetical protein